MESGDSIPYAAVIKSILAVTLSRKPLCVGIFRLIKISASLKGTLRKIILPLH